MSLAAAGLLSIWLLTVGLVIGALHYTLGLVMLLALSLLAPFGSAWQGITSTSVAAAWPIMLLVPLVSLALAAQIRAQSPSRAVDRWWRLVVAVAAGLAGYLVARFAIGQVPTGYVWGALTTGGLALAWSAATNDTDGLFSDNSDNPALLGLIITGVASHRLGLAALWALVHAQPDRVAQRLPSRALHDSGSHRGAPCRAAAQSALWPDTQRAQKPAGDADLALLRAVPHPRLAVRRAVRAADSRRCRRPVQPRHAGYPYPTRERSAVIFDRLSGDRRASRAGSQRLRSSRNLPGRPRCSGCSHRSFPWPLSVRFCFMVQRSCSQSQDRIGPP